MTDSVPAHQIAYVRLADMVLFGELAPGAAVTIEGLVRLLALGMTPVREAIRRLLAEGALQMQGNRRVCVPRLDGAALEDLGYARTAIETRLAQRAFHRCDASVIEQLRLIDMQVDKTILSGDIPGYLRANRAFHFTLYERARSEVLLSMAASLWLRLGPSLRVVCLGEAHVPAKGADGMGLHEPDNHKRALAALAVGRVDALVEAISDDIAQGVSNIRAGIEAGAFA